MAAGVSATYTLTASVLADPAQPLPLANGVQVLAQIAPLASAYYYANVAIDPSQAVPAVAPAPHSWAVPPRLKRRR
jgi:hypothetical protein